MNKEMRESLISMGVTLIISGTLAAFDIMKESAAEKKAKDLKNKINDVMQEQCEKYPEINTIYGEKYNKKKNPFNKVFGKKKVNYDIFREDIKDAIEKQHLKKLLKPVGEEKMRVDEEREIMADMNDQEKEAYIQYKIKEAARKMGLDVGDDEALGLE